MKSCPKCHGQSPDTAPSCQHCGTVLDQGVISRAGGPPVGRTTTIVEPQRSDTLDLRPTPPSAPPPSALPVPDPSSTPGKGGGRRGHTVYMPPPAEPSSQAAGAPAAGPSAAARKVVAILVTYSWKPDGQVFPVREGRNLIGRGDECDIRIPEDPMLSQVNSHITFRQNFVLGDMVSMSGTDLNGSPVEEQFRPLENHATIRTGSTHWHFVIVDPAILSKSQERG